MPEVLARSGQAARVSRVYLFEARWDDGQWVVDAEDIHDDSVQIMTAAALRIEVVRRELGPSPHAEALARLERTVNEAIGRLRRRLFELRPRALDQEGLAAALRLSLGRLEQETGLRWAVQDRLAVEPDPQTRMARFRIAQEALTNVREHAEAHRVEVTVEERDGGYLLRVRDDGRGFRIAEQATGSPDHLGLASMRERAEMAGGGCGSTLGSDRAPRWRPGSRRPGTRAGRARPSGGARRARGPRRGRPARMDANPVSGAALSVDGAMTTALP